MANVLAWCEAERASATRLHGPVHVGNPVVSDINRSALTASTSVPTKGLVARHRLWSSMLVVALILLGVEWVTYHRKVTL
jgi:hypothetical protein